MMTLDESDCPTLGSSFIKSALGGACRSRGGTAYFVFGSAEQSGAVPRLNEMEL